MDQGTHTSTLFTQYLFRKSWIPATFIFVLSIVVSSAIIALPRFQAVHAVHAAHAKIATLQVFPGSPQVYYSQTKLRVQGSNYPAGKPVTVYWNYQDANNTGTTEFSVTTDSKGAFTGAFSLPLAPTGSYTIAGVFAGDSQTPAVVVTSAFQLLPNLSVTPRATGPGSRFTLSGVAFGAQETVKIYWNYTGPGTGLLLTSVTGDATGSFQTTATIPSNTTTYGNTPITGIGQTSNATATGKIIVYQPTLALAPLSGSAGTALTLSAYGFQSNETVKAYWNNATTPIFTYNTNANGYVPPMVYTVPVGTTPGSYSVQIVGSISHRTVLNTFTVVAPSSSLSLSSSPIGAKIRVSGQGYAPSETVNIYWAYNSLGVKNVTSTQASLSGILHVSFLVPANTNGHPTPNGSYTVAAIGATSKSITQNTFKVASGLAVSPTSFAPAQSTNVAASGFQANEAVKLYWDSTSGSGVRLSTINTDGNGNVNLPVTIPSSATPGSHTLFGVGQTSGISFKTSVTVNAMWNDFGFGTAHLRENSFENSVSSANVANLQLKWQANIGSEPEGAPSPVYYNGLIYIATLDGQLKAYDPATGAVVWHFDTGTTFANLSSPVVDPATNTIFFGTLGFLAEQDHGVPSPFYALDAQSGTLKWSLIIPGDDYAFPTVAFNTIYVGLANEGGGFLLAIDEASGSLIGQYRANGGVWGAVGVDVKTNMIFTGVGNPGDQVLAFDATTFKGTAITPTWQVSIVSPGNDDDIGAAMAVANGLVYVDSKNGNMYALNENTGAQVWQAKVGASSQGNVSSPAVGANGTLYVGSLNGNLYALNAMTGSLVWKVKTGGEIYSSPALANGVVYIASNDKNMYAFDATSGQQKWFYATGGATFSSPIIVNGWLYCASVDGNMYAFSL